MPRRISLRRHPRTGPPPDGDGVLVLRRGRRYDPAWDLWRPAHRWPGVLLAALATAGLLTAVAYHYEHRAAAAPKAIFRATPKLKESGAYFPPVSKDKDHTVVLSGTKSEFLVPFTSPGGLSTWTLQCRCFNNFNAVVRTTNGTIVDVPVNTTGSTHVVATANYPAGKYTISVGADGPWKIQLINEAGLPVLKTPFSYLSTGTSVLGPFPARARTMIDGYEANLGQLFSIQEVDKTDGVIKNLVLTTKSAFQTVALSAQPAPFYLIVNGAGTWVVEVK